MVAIAIAVGVLIMPVLWISIDLAAYLRARSGPAVSSIPAGHGEHDFTLLVPIYGSTKYLENVEFLKPYGRRVVFCTTATETQEFYDSLSAIARAAMSSGPPAKNGMTSLTM